MLTIKRACTNKIMTRALNIGSRPLLAILPADADDCLPCEAQNLQQMCAHFSAAAIVFNQHPQMQDLIDQLEVSNSQVLIEIRQDTKGVLGLHASRKNAGGRETLELIYQ